MTARTVEDLLLEHTKTIASLDESQKNLRERFTKLEASNTKHSDELRKLIEGQHAESAELNVRLSLAEKEITDLKVILERGRSFRWALAATLISVGLSSISSAIIAFYVKPR
jgi:predicted RNase H-like nuclease (RuvC/YqgF family)